MGGGNGEDEVLASAYRSSLDAAAEIGARTVAFPSISTGVYGFPIARAAPLALGEVRAGLARHAGIGAVTFVCFDAENHAAYAGLLAGD